MSLTRIIQFSSEHPIIHELEDAVEVLHAGGLVAFPTETVYGLGADALNIEAVQKVFDAKGRPSDNPLIIHISSIEGISQFSASIPSKGLHLAHKYWPGPLTLVLKRNENVPDIVTAGLDTVALRVPNHPVTIELLNKYGGGIVGPSANISGRPSPTTAEHVLHDLDGKVDLILDAGPTTIGVESTVLDVTIDPPVILRLGGLSKEVIEQEIGKVQQTSDKELLHRSPGTRHRHYAPLASIILLPPEESEELMKQIALLNAHQKKFGIISYSKSLRKIKQSTHHIQLESSIESVAKNLFDALRQLDKYGVDVILVESVPEQGLGAAVMDRLRKAALR
jgi:L-threonylcarbamoyladenylate synthase